MILVCRFEEQYLTNQDIVNALHRANVKLTYGIYNHRFNVHFYIKHRYALSVRHLFSEKKHFEMRVSRFN